MTLEKLKEIELEFEKRNLWGIEIFGLIITNRKSINKIKEIAVKEYKLNKLNKK